MLIGNWQKRFKIKINLTPQRLRLSSYYFTPRNFGTYSLRKIFDKQLITIVIKGPKLVCTLNISQVESYFRFNPLMELTAVLTAITLGGKRNQKYSPIVQSALWLSIRRILLTLGITSCRMNLLGIVKNPRKVLRQIFQPQREIFQHPLTGHAIWDITILPEYTQRISYQQFSEITIEAATHTTNLVTNSSWVQEGLEDLHLRWGFACLKTPRFNYRIAIREIWIQSKQSYLSVKNQVGRRRLRSLARRQTKRLIRQTQHRFWPSC